MIPLKHLVIDQLKRHSKFLLPSFLRQLHPVLTSSLSIRLKSKHSNSNVSSLFQPVDVKSNSDDINVGAELTGNLDKNCIITVLSTFAHKKSIRELALKYGFDDILLNTALNSFRNYCMTSEPLPVDLHVILNDVIQGAGNISDIFPYFLRYAKQIYPHIDCLDDLKKISDLRHPPNWYPLARKKKRKIIFHSGPTNSGKTYHALQRFMSANSGVYCGPLKLLAVEVFNKSNSMGTPCDLITGEERRYARNEMSPANHVACSVEMVNLNNEFEIAVVDEIQLLRDGSRGWAWTRAVLGLSADEVHLCGESAAIPIVESMCATVGEQVEVKQYKRLTNLTVENHALQSLSHVQPGDCIVCFNKNDIFYVSQTIEKLGKQVAVIYGSLPPGTKLAQAARFNDVNDGCKILVATNAIGMGLNLHIRRIIFYSVYQPTVNEKGEKEIDVLSVSSALQIAGRAGRFNTQWENGFVTTFKSEDLPVLKKLLKETPEIIVKAGLHPTADQIELYAYQLPNTPLSNLINIFVALSQVDDSLYFICNLNDFKFLADMIQHIPLNLRTQYVFCCAPINRKEPFVCSMFLKYARQCSNNSKITVKWLCQQINWPPKPPGNISDLVHLEAVFDVLDIYLWFSYRFTDLFPDGSAVREIQQELDKIIEIGVKKLKILFQQSDEQTDQDRTNITECQTERSIYRDSADTLPKGKVTQRLISEGVLTPKLLEQLQKEWFQKRSDSNDYNNFNKSNSNNRRKRK
ncbi:PREDICTED: ATP-dependent RNA helicase SUV3 homolog, mitochondrial [Dufourea novaeangliae]|uniref:ATP-dependent RNA helicase SUV3 homolog, mitochondrial n=1 Tax=Dufourea novaeangliae TaxID=178035 RepID=UPI000766EE42|nr:PREDICTED: ATP-dependent RNA helicase SUV3 homolog, mitochondrial [Dufourea novaeangliae]